MISTPQKVHRRVVLIHWKNDQLKPYEVYSNLKNFSLAYPRYSYDTLNNYLSKKKKPFEDDQVRIERKEIITVPPKQVKPKLPKRLFWEYIYDKIDWQKDAKNVIERVIERGSPSEWDEMIKFYGEKKIKHLLKTKINYLTERAVQKVCDFFKLKPEDLKCYARKRSKPQHWI